MILLYVLRTDSHHRYLLQTIFAPINVYCDALDGFRKAL